MEELKKVDKDKNGENVLHLEYNEVVSIHCKFVSNAYQQDLRVLYTSFPNNLFHQLIDIPKLRLVILLAIKLLIQLPSYQEVKTKQFRNS